MIAGIALLVAAPLGMTAFESLDPYEFQDPDSDSAKASDALEEVTGVRADGTVIALVEGPPGPTRATSGSRRSAPSWPRSRGSSPS